MRRSRRWLLIVAVGSILAALSCWVWYDVRQEADGAAADGLIADLRTDSERINRELASFPDLPDPPTEAGLDVQRRQLMEMLQTTADRVTEFHERAADIRRPPSAKRSQLTDALASHIVRANRVKEKIDDRLGLLSALTDAVSGQARPGQPVTLRLKIPPKDASDQVSYWTVTTPVVASALRKDRPREFDTGFVGKPLRLIGTVKRVERTDAGCSIYLDAGKYKDIRLQVDAEQVTGEGGKLIVGDISVCMDADYSGPDSDGLVFSHCRLVESYSDWEQADDALKWFQAEFDAGRQHNTSKGRDAGRKK